MIHCGDALTVLRTLPEASVNCCVTSPPYWGLRDYGTAQWEGGAADCDHAYNHGVQGVTGERADRTFTGQAVYRQSCGKCGARRIDQQLGLEKTPEGYISRMVEVFRECCGTMEHCGSISGIRTRTTRSGAGNLAARMRPPPPAATKAKGSGVGWIAIQSEGRPHQVSR